MERTMKRVVFPTPQPIEVTRVAAYARVSSGKDAMLHSLSAQSSYYSSLIQKHPGWLYCGVYADEALTGTKDSRENFQRLLTACRNAFRQRSQRDSKRAERGWRPHAQKRAMVYAWRPARSGELRLYWELAPAKNISGESLVEAHAHERRTAPDVPCGKGARSDHRSRDFLRSPSTTRSRRVSTSQSFRAYAPKQEIRCGFATRTVQKSLNIGPTAPVHNHGHRR